MKKILAFLLLLVVLAGAAVSFKVFMSSQSRGENETFIYSIQPGVGLNKVLSDMKEKKVVEDLMTAKLIAKVLGYSKQVRVGEYNIPEKIKLMELFQIFSSGKSVEYKVTVPEGMNMYEIAALVENKGLGTKKKFLSLCRDRKFISQLLGESLESLEGYLFPETYSVTKFTGEKKLIEIMVARFLEVYAKILAESNKKKMNRHDLVILSSVIEKETGATGERAKISSVFHNRLKKKMKLQSDPTIIYGILDKTGVEPKNIRKKDILAPTRFNTYTVKALPAGPIASPGEAALRATLNPIESPYFYFVSMNQGTHYFSKTYEEHLGAVRKYQLNKKMRQGKSWRDLKNK